MENNIKYTPNPIINIESDYNKSLYEKVGFFKTNYPLTQMGLYQFLIKEKNIDILFTSLINNKWIYQAIDKNDNDNPFTEDFTEYDSFNTMMNNAILECFAYLSLQK